MHYNGADSYLFANGTDIHKLKAKDSKNTPLTMWLGNVSGSFSADNMEKAGLYETVFDFSIDYKTISVDDALDIQKYLMEKNNIK